MCYWSEKSLIASEQVASDHRTRRHAASQSTPARPVCPNVTESVLQTSVSTVTFVAIADHKTDTLAVQRYGHNQLSTASKEATLLLV